MEFNAEKEPAWFPESKVYFNGSQHIAIPHTTRRYKKRPKKVEKVFVVVRFLLTFRQLTRVIGYFILGLHLLSASSQKTTQHGNQQKKGQASFGCLFHK